MSDSRWMLGSVGSLHRLRVGCTVRELVAIDDLIVGREKGEGEGS